MSGLWKRTRGKSSQPTSTGAAESTTSTSRKRRVNKKLLLVLAVIIIVLAVGGYLLYAYIADKNKPAPPTEQTEKNAIQTTINQYSDKAKTPEEHLLLANIYMGDQKYQEAVDEIEKAYETSRDVSILARQSIIMMDNLQDKGSDRLRRNIAALNGKSNLSPETTYRLAQLLEKTELAGEAKKFYQLTLDNFAKVTKDSVVTKKELRAKLNEN